MNHNHSTTSKEEPSKSPQSDKPAGIYVHVPFCKRKCGYCDFYSITDLDLITRFVPAAKHEMTLVAEKPSRFDTIYFGGGTPSLLKPAQIGEIIDTAFESFPLLPVSEITLEVNPGTVTHAALKDYRKIGVNRIHIGVQSFEEHLLAFLGRMHTAQEALQAYQWARSAGFDNVGIDLIYAIPGQTKKSWLRDLETVAALGPEHVSAYTLTYEPGTPVSAKREAGHFEPHPDAAVAAMMEMTASCLTSRGYGHYEISNFARSNAMRSRHNQKYWSHTPYIGFGPSAHSFVGNRRYWNYDHTQRYIALVDSGILPIEGQEILTDEQRLIEALYLGLRRSEGIDLGRFRIRFGRRLTENLDGLMGTLKEDEYTAKESGRWLLTLKGMRLHESVTRYIIDQLGDG